MNHGEKLEEALLDAATCFPRACPWLLRPTGKEPRTRPPPVALHTSPGVGGHEGDSDSARATAVSCQHGPVLPGWGCAGCSPRTGHQHGEALGQARSANDGSTRKGPFPSPLCPAMGTVPWGPSV